MSYANKSICLKLITEKYNSITGLPNTSHKKVNYSTKQEQPNLIPVIDNLQIGQTILFCKAHSF